MCVTLARAFADEHGVFFVDFVEAKNVIDGRGRERGIVSIFADDVASGEVERRRKAHDIVVRRGSAGAGARALTRAGFRFLGCGEQDAILPSPMLPPQRDCRAFLANSSVRKVNGGLGIGGSGLGSRVSVFGNGNAAHPNPEPREPKTDHHSSLTLGSSRDVSISSESAQMAASARSVASALSSAPSAINSSSSCASGAQWKMRFCS